MYSDEDGVYTSCNITFMNRKKQGKINVNQLDAKTEGYLLFSTKNKSEKPVNLILKLDYLEQIGVAKRLGLNKMSANICHSLNILLCGIPSSKYSSPKALKPSSV